MKNAILYAIGFFLLASSAHAELSPARSATRILPKIGKPDSDQRAVNQARVKLMNDARKLGPDSPQVQEDKEALISAIEKLRGDSAVSPHPVNVKRNSRAPHVLHRGNRKRAGQKVSHPRARKQKEGTV